MEVSGQPSMSASMVVTASEVEREEDDDYDMPSSPILEKAAPPLIEPSTSSIPTLSEDVTKQGEMEVLPESEDSGFGSQDVPADSLTQTDLMPPPTAKEMMSEPYQPPQTLATHGNLVSMCKLLG